MLLSIKQQIRGTGLDAADAALGTVKDVYFDDERWVMRYLVVDTGTWLPGRLVLVSPYSIGGFDRQRGRLDVRLTRTEIENGPSIETDKPVSRQQEAQYLGHYGFPLYWNGPLLWGATGYPAVGTLQPVARPQEALPPQTRERIERKRQQADHHLRSSSEVSGYHIQASDGGIGHVDDFLFDERSWQIRYVVVDTRNWWPGKHVLLSPRWIGRIDWAERKVHVPVNRAHVRSSPPYDPAMPVSAEYERRLYGHYGHPYESL